MTNKLADLNNYLFEALERVTDDSLSDEELRKEINRSQAVTSIAETIISNGTLALKAKQHMDEYYGDGDKRLPPMLEA